MRDVGRVLDMGYNLLRPLSKLIPVEPGKPLSLDPAGGGVERRAAAQRRERRGRGEVRELLALAGRSKA
jgi:DNA polymerase III alpha subunit